MQYFVWICHQQKSTKTKDAKFMQEPKKKKVKQPQDEPRPLGGSQPRLDWARGNALKFPGLVEALFHKQQWVSQTVETVIHPIPNSFPPLLFLCCTFKSPNFDIQKGQERFDFCTEVIYSPESHRLNTTEKFPPFPNDCSISVSRIWLF